MAEKRIQQVNWKNYKKRVPRTCQDCRVGFMALVGKIKKGGGKFCNKCVRKHRYPPVEQRFWASVNKNGPIVRPALGHCWVWTGGKVSKTKPYGKMTHWENGKNRHQTAHRFSYELRSGPIPDKMCVLHRCDNPPCVNPDHLFLGTAKDNTRDKLLKERSTSPFSAVQVREMRRMYKRGNISMAAIGRLNGINERTAAGIISGRRWAHLD